MTFKFSVILWESWFYFYLRKNQCCGSMTFWCGSGSGSGSGSADPCLWWIRMRIRLFSSLIFKIPTKRNFSYIKFSTYYFLKVHTFSPFFNKEKKIKSKKKLQSSRNQSFSYYFCLMKEGSGSGSIPLTNGSGSGSRRPKNIRIRDTGTNIANIEIS